MSSPAATTHPSAGAEEATLREVVETLAPLARRAGSPEEQQAAHWIAERLQRAGARARVEEEQFRDGYARQLLPLAVASTLAGAAVSAGRSRRLAGAIGALAVAAIVDDASNGVRVWRRLVSRPQPTWNVVAGAGDSAGERTLVVMAHHDAAPTGQVFDQTLQREMAERFPGIVERIDTSLPLWWPVVAGPALVALGAVTGRRALGAAGTALSAAEIALGADIARSPVVPGERQPQRRGRAGRPGRAPAR